MEVIRGDGQSAAIQLIMRWNFKIIVIYMLASMSQKCRAIACWLRCVFVIYKQYLVQCGAIQFDFLQESPRK